MLLRFFFFFNLRYSLYFNNTVKLKVWIILSLCDEPLVCVTSDTPVLNTVAAALPMLAPLPLPLLCGWTCVIKRSTVLTQNFCAVTRSRLRYGGLGDVCGNEVRFTQAKINTVKR